MTLKDLFALILLCWSLASCSESPSKQANKNQGVSTKYAVNFSIEPKNGYTLLHILNPNDGKIEKSLACRKDENAQIPDKYPELKIPSEKIITLSGTHIGMLDKLGSTNLIKGVSNKKYIHNSSLLKRINNKDVIEMGEEGMIPLESIINSKAQLVLYSGFGNEFPHEKQLRQIGIYCFPIYDWREEHPLGKAEWIKFFGVLVNKEAEANAYFDSIEKKYLELKARTAKIKHKPTVISGHAYGDYWYSPSGENYFAVYLKDAGMDYIYKHVKGTQSVQKSMEQILIDTRETEIWIDPRGTSIVEIEQIDPKHKHLNMVKNGRIYGYFHNNNYYWEMSVIEPHHILSDLISIAHPELGINTSYFYKPVK